jgi:lariat debranching enzyme
MGLLKTLRPDWWFSAHLHVRFEATVVHSDGPSTTASGSTSSSGVDAATAAKGQNPDEIIIDDDDEELAEVKAAVGTVQSPAVADVTELPAAVQRNPDEITLDDEEEDVVAPPPPLPRLPQGKPNQTKFLALDKCLPRRQFMEVSSRPQHISQHSHIFQIIDIPTPAPTPTTPILTYDAEWLAITRAFHPLLSTTISQPSFPSEASARQMVQNELTWVKENVGDADRLEVGERQLFVMTAPGPGQEGSAKEQRKSFFPHFFFLRLSSLVVVSDERGTMDSAVVHQPADRSFLPHAWAGK